MKVTKSDSLEYSKQPVYKNFITFLAVESSTSFSKVKEVEVSKAFSI